jgi:hypothetical protein
MAGKCLERCVQHAADGELNETFSMAIHDEMLLFGLGSSMKDGQYPKCNIQSSPH